MSVLSRRLYGSPTSPGTGPFRLSPGRRRVDDLAVDHSEFAVEDAAFGLVSGDLEALEEPICGERIDAAELRHKLVFAERAFQRVRGGDRDEHGGGNAAIPALIPSPIRDRQVCQRARRAENAYGRDTREERDRADVVQVGPLLHRQQRDSDREEARAVEEQALEDRINLIQDQEYSHGPQAAHEPGAHDAIAAVVVSAHRVGEAVKERLLDTFAVLSQRSVRADP